MIRLFYVRGFPLLNRFISFLNLCSMGCIIVLWFVQNRFQFDTGSLSWLYSLAFGCFRLPRFLFLGCVCLSQVVFLRLSLIQNVCGGSRSFKILFRIVLGCC